MTPDALLLRTPAPADGMTGRPEMRARDESTRERGFDKALEREKRVADRAHAEDRPSTSRSALQEASGSVVEAEDGPDKEEDGDAGDVIGNAAASRSEVFSASGDAPALLPTAVMDGLPGLRLPGEPALESAAGTDIPPMLSDGRMKTGLASEVSQGTFAGVELSGRAGLHQVAMHPLQAAIRASGSESGQSSREALGSLLLNDADTGTELFRNALLKGTEAPDSRAFAHSLNTGGAPAAARPDAPAPYITQLMHPAGSERWQHELGEKMLWMVNQQVHKARIHLNPADLGPIDIQVQVHKDQAQVQVHATQMMTRDMLDAAAWRLREALAGQGLNLSGFDVSDQPAWQDSPAGQSEEKAPGGQAEAGIEDGMGEGPVDSRARVTAVPGLVDTYA